MIYCSEFEGKTMKAAVKAMNAGLDDEGVVTVISIETTYDGTNLKCLRVWWKAGVACRETKK